MKKVALHNLGCKVNAYETEAVQQMLEECGYEIVPFHEYADVYIINTCSVTNMADRKSRQMLHRAKKQNPDAVVVAMGCYVQTAAEEVKNDTAVDIVIGNNKKHELPGLLRKYEEEKANGATIPAASLPGDVKTEEGQFVALVEFDWAEYLRKNDTRTVKKTLTIPAWLNALAEEQHINFSGVLKSALIEKLHA